MSIRNRLPLLAFVATSVVLGGTVSIASPVRSTDRPSPTLGNDTTPSLGARPESPAEDVLAAVVRATYERLARYSRLGNEPGLQFQLSGFKTIPPERFDTVPVADVVTEPTGRLIDVDIERHLGGAGGPYARYRASWAPNEVPELSADDRRQQQETTLGDLVRALQREVPQQAPILAVVTYEVTVDLSSRSRTYRAAFLWMRLPGPGTEAQSVEFVVQDPVVLGLAEVARQGDRPSAVDDGKGPAMASPREEAGLVATAPRLLEAGPQCSETFRNFPNVVSVPPTSSQRFTARLEGNIECRCDTSCYSSCTARIQFTDCHATTGCRRVSQAAYDAKDETRFAFGTPLGAACAYGAQCVGEKCTRFLFFLPCYCGALSTTVSVGDKIGSKYEVKYTPPPNATWKATIGDSLVCAPCFAGESIPSGDPVDRWQVATIEDNSEPECGDGLCDDGESCSADCSGSPSHPGYQGCYTDDGSRALPAALGGGHTIDSCIAAAAAQGYPYAGLQWYGQCFGGDALRYSQVSDTECNTPCDAEPTQPCGGAWRNSIYATGAGSPPPPPPGSSGILSPGQTLFPNDAVHSSDNRFTLTYQPDGNLVLYQTGVGAIWSSGTYGTSAGHTKMQDDGNLVVYDAGGAPVWHTVTFGNPGAYLKVQIDGNTVVYSAAGGPLWSTGTCCR